MNDKLREAAQAVVDRALDFFDDDDLDPESSLAMPVVLKARDVAALRAALAQPSEPGLDDPTVTINEKALRDAWLRMDAVGDPHTAHTLWQHLLGVSEEVKG